MIFQFFFLNQFPFFRKLKGSIAFLLSCTLILGLVGCEGKSVAGRDVFTTGKELKTPEKTIKVYTPSASERGVSLAVAEIFQGVINKRKPEVYIANNISAKGVNVSAVMEKILAEYGEVDLVSQEMDTIKAHQDFSVFWAMWRDYSDIVENIYIFETAEGLQSSLNVAAMLSGRNSGVAVTRALFEEMSSEGVIGDRNVIDVCKECGFDSTAGTLGINRYIRDNMVEGANKELIFMLYPGGRGEDSNSYPALYDFAVATGGLIYWIDPNDDSYKEIQQEILDQFGSNAFVIGWPGLDMEAAYVSSIAECGKDVVCADWGFSNGSLYAGFEDYYPTECTTPVEADREKVYNNKVYVSFTVSDGDAWHYATKELLAYWNSPVRGSVPITWTIPTLFAKFHPTLLRYIYATKTPLDEFIQGPSGVGYVYPSLMPEVAYDDYLAKTVSAFEKTKINMVNYWDSSDSCYTKDNEKLIKYCNTVKPEAIFMGHCSSENDYFMIGDVVCVSEMGFGNLRGTHCAEEILSNIDGAVGRSGDDKPVFIAINVEAWGEGVSTIAETCAKIRGREDSERYEFVTLASLVGKIKRYEKHGADGTFDIVDPIVQSP